MRKTSILAASVFALLAAFGVAGPSFASPAPPALLPGMPGGNAYGTWANARAGNIATQLGRSAYQACPCRGTNGQVMSASAQHVSSGNTARTNRIDTSAQADKTASTAYSVLKSQTEGTSLLGDRISVRLIRAVARTDATESRVHSTARNSQFTDLQILGNPLNHVQPNSRVDLPGFGHVLLREVQRHGDGVDRSSIIVNMIHVFVTQKNSLNIPVGTEIVVGHAQSAYRRGTRDTSFSGYAFATSGESSSNQTENQLGRSAATYLGCTGTSNQTQTNSVNSTGSSSTLRTGTGSTSVMGGFDGSVANAVATSNIQDVRLLAGMITADAVRGVARSNYDTGTLQRGTSFAGSRFVNLRVAGRPIADDVAPNTKIDLLGIGYVILNRQDGKATAKAANARVAMIEVHVTLANGLNLPVGTTLMVGVAKVTVAPF